MRIVIVALLLVLTLAPQGVHANDGFAAQGVGGVTIAKTNNIAILKEVLDVSCDNIHVSYDFINESEQDEDAVLMFPIPDYSAAMPETYIIAQGQPADFSITVNGKPVQYKTQVKAIDIKYADKNRKLIKEQDVTGKLKGLGLTDKEIADFPFNTEWDSALQQYVYKNISKIMLDALDKKGFLEKMDGQASWINRVTYVWHQRFPAKTTVHVEHSYRPFISEGSVAGFSEYSDFKEFCISDKQLNILQKLYANEKRRDAYNQIHGINVKYILTTANSWKDGIRDFKLRIHAKSKDEIVATCFPVKIEQVSDMLYEASVRNFHPKEELLVYLGNASDCNVNHGVPPDFR